MNDALSFLQIGLARSFAAGVRAPETWADPAGMTRVLARVQREHGGPGIAADSRSILAAIASFRKTGSIHGIRDLKYICLGVGLIDRDGSVLADPKLRSKLVALVSSQSELRRRFRCFQALLSSYWAFPINDAKTMEEAKEGWRELRIWLRTERRNITRSEEAKALWFAALTRHVELLSNEPCDKFGADLLRGDSSGLNDAIESLAIPRNSWVLEDSIFAYVNAAAGLADERFKDLLPQILPIVLGRGEVKIGEALQIRCIALLISRYSGCKDRPEQTALRDAAISTIGNPWLQRAKWDAWVLDGKGTPDDKAREMVNGWLKRRLISDFFELLTDDGTGDPRRLDYWLRFEPYIEDMWFALGGDARSSKGEHFDDFRVRARGRLLDLEDTTGDNNAFVMRIGEYLAVEFGAKGHAFYLFKWDSLGKPLAKTLTSGLAHARVSLRKLKASNHDERLIHRDSAAESWEQKFDERICGTLGCRPADPPRGTRGTTLARAVRSTTPTEWNSFVRANQLSVEDLRPKRGALWVLGQDLPRTVVTQLEKWGFRPRAPRGWFKE